MSNRETASKVVLSTDLDDPEAYPYFLWDDPMTNRQIHDFLSSASEPERHRLLAKILREARDPDVWTYTTPHDVARLWPQLERHLGRRRAFWKYLLGRWADFGIIDFEPA